MRDPWLVFVHTLVALSIVCKCVDADDNILTMEDGRINDYLEIYVDDNETDGKVTAYAFFSEYGVDVTCPFFQFDVKLSDGALQDGFHHIIPFGDAYQIHSFAYLADKNITIFSWSALEPAVSTFRLFYHYEDVFGFRNLLFFSKDDVSTFQYMQIEASRNRSSFTSHALSELQYTFKDYGWNSTDLSQVAGCFNGRFNCHMNRDDSRLVKRPPLTKHVMYSAFNFTVYQSFSEVYMVEYVDDREIRYNIPPQLQTHISAMPGLKRVALIPMLTTSSQMVQEKIGWIYKQNSVGALGPAIIVTTTAPLTLMLLLRTVRV